ncbi:unnamed protein product [Brachionus calyciflorus]|uniref:Uncharacterized protein n=1 Tax=Brachionus calyciflorus TaxID=104777 RepID=A0A814SIM7_9BILA|nr:unnamed protein product [Brachionus calyciflorus]
MADLENKKNYYDHDERNDVFQQHENFMFNPESNGGIVKKKLNLTSNSNPELLAKSNSISEGALSLTHQSLQSDNGQLGRQKSKIEESLTTKYNHHVVKLNDLDNDGSPSELEQRRRMSLSSEAKLAEELRKQKFENLLNTHIENLRASSSNDKLKTNFV